MNAERHSIIAFLATLIAIAAITIWGAGTDLAVITGLVGVLGTFRPTNNKPTGTTESGDVNVGKEP